MLNKFQLKNRKMLSFIIKDSWNKNSLIQQAFLLTMKANH